MKDALTVAFTIIIVFVIVGAVAILGTGIALQVGPVLFPSSTPTPLPTPTPIPGSISGTASWQLKNGSNIVLPGLVVSVKKCVGCKAYAVGVTDGMGKYTITGLEPTAYWLTAYQSPSDFVAEKCWFMATAVIPGTDTQVNLYYGNTIDPIMCK